jgi:hypothetical protein
MRFRRRGLYGSTRRELIAVLPELLLEEDPVNRTWFRATLTLSLTVLSPFSPAEALHVGTGRPTTDAHGDPLPTDAVARFGTIRLRHATSVSSLAYSADAKRISSSTIWFDAGVWDAHTGQSLAFRSSRQDNG